MTENVHEVGGDAYEFRQIHVHGAAAVCTRECPAYDAMLAEKTRARFNLTQAQNERGEWVPAIPEPYFLTFGRVRCDCGEKLRSRSRYREHYALTHILGLR